MIDMLTTFLRRAYADHIVEPFHRGRRDLMRGLRMLRYTAADLLVHKVLIPLAAVTLLVVSMGGRWRLAHAAPGVASQKPAPKGSGAPAAKPVTSPDDPTLDGETPLHVVKKSAAELTGKINLNTANEDQLMLLPTVGPSKAERIVTWRKKNGGFRRTADLRRVKGFGYKTFKRLEPFLDIKGETTLH